MTRNDDAAPQPWERQPGETAKSFAVFTTYRDLPPSSRSLVRAAREHYGDQTITADSPKVRVMKDWSGRHEWVLRCAAYDSSLDSHALEQRADEIAAMAKRHADAARVMVSKGLERLLALDVDSLTAPQLCVMIVDGAKLERLARGEPETTTADLTAGREQDAVRDLLMGDADLADAALNLALLANEKQTGEQLPANVRPIAQAPSRRRAKKKPARRKAIR